MGCGGSTDYLVEDIDFENAEPQSAEERALWDEVTPLLEQVGDILEELASYKGCAEFIKLAVRTPSTENDVAAWNAVVPAVNMLKRFFDFYAEFRDGLVKLLVFVCQDQPRLALSENLGVAKLIVRMFDFIIRFDELKMGKASIQNDFSFYRRSMNRMKRGAVELKVSSPPVNDEVANRMSLFFAYPNPFTKALIDEFLKNEQLTEDASPKPELQVTFAIIANACKDIANEHPPSDASRKEQNFTLFRAMVAAIMFYDYTSTEGVFVKKSQIDVVGCIMALKKYENDATDLLNTIRYGTKTFNSESTPRKIADLMS